MIRKRIFIFPLSSAGEGIESISIEGLKGLSYLDKSVDPNNPTERKEERDLVSISGPTDSVYLGMALQNRYFL